MSKRSIYGVFYHPADPTQMVVTWVTLESTNGSVVEYGLDAMDQITWHGEETFTDGGSQKRTITMHRVVMKNLKPGTKYGKYWI